jgi:hypothetical protein
VAYILLFINQTKNPNSLLIDKVRPQTKCVCDEPVVFIEILKEYSNHSSG